jgi:uncharacterized lipoprotein YmbA
MSRSVQKWAAFGRAGLIALGATAVTLAGCGHSPQTRFFTLDALPPTGGAAGASFTGPPLRLDSVHVPAALDRVEVVRQFAANELDVSDLDHWGAPLGELARRALTQDLNERLPAGAVIFPDSPKPALAQDLIVDVLDIHTQGGAVTVTASYTLVQTRPQVSKIQRQVVLSTLQASTDAAGQADALSRILAQLADKIAADLAKTSTAAG